MRGGRCDMARLRGISSPWVGGSVYSGVRRLLRRQPPTPPPPTPNPPSLHAPSPFEHNHAHPLPLPPAAGPDAGGGAEQPSPPPSPHRSRRHMRVGARVVARVGGIESERQSASYGQTIVGSIREGGTEGGGCGVSERALGRQCRDTTIPGQNRFQQARHSFRNREGRPQRFFTYQNTLICFVQPVVHKLARSRAGRCCRRDPHPTAGSPPPPLLGQGWRRLRAPPPSRHGRAPFRPATGTRRTHEAAWARPAHHAASATVPSCPPHESRNGV